MCTLSTKISKIASVPVLISQHTNAQPTVNIVFKNGRFVNGREVPMLIVNAVTREALRRHVRTLS